MAKSYKFTNNRKAKFLELLRSGSLRGEAAEACGVTRQTVRAARNADEQFDAACEDAEIDAAESVEAALFTKACEGNVSAILSWLYNRSPDRWSYRGPRRPERDDDGEPVKVYCRSCNRRFSGEHTDQQ